jgi:hypothetical protein
MYVLLISPRAIRRLWCARKTTLKEICLRLTCILQPHLPSPPTLVVHGISATCKSTIIRGVLSTLEVPHAVVRSSECITGRHLLTKILWNTLEALGQKDEWEKFGKGRCEHVSTLAVLLEECLATRTPEKRGKFVLVLDEIDRQREAPHTLLSALARLGEIVSFQAEKILEQCNTDNLNRSPRSVLFWSSARLLDLCSFKIQQFRISASLRTHAKRPLISFWPPQYPPWKAYPMNHQIKVTLILSLPSMIL